jgi:biopolymer transport protein ExbD
MPIKFRCPKCRQKYSVETKHAGRKIRCEKCNSKLRVPETEPAAEDDARVEGPDQDETSQPFEKPPERQAALKNLLDDDDEDDIFEGVSEDGEPDELEFAEAPAEENAADNTPAVSSGNEEDDLAAVLAFDESLDETGGPEKNIVAPLPDELFSEDEDEEDEVFGGRRELEDDEMDLTPMVDVTFLLLIFFMITASFSVQKSLEVPAPDPEEKGQSASIVNPEDFEEESVMVEIDARNLVMVDEQIVSDLNLLPKVLRSAHKTEIFIVAHEDCLHEVVVRVIDASNEVGLQKIRIGLKLGNR